MKLTKILKIIIYIIIVSLLFAAASYYFANDFYRKLVAEDGIFENVTAIVLLAISVLFFIRLLKSWKTRNTYWIIFSLLIVMGSFFGFGEEISWGQRIFSIESGDFFQQNNMQSETNLHNLEIGGVSINKLIFSQGITVLFGIYFVFSLLMYKRINFFKKIVDLFGVQIPRIKHSAILLAYTGVILISQDVRRWELWEAFFVILLLLVFIEPFNEREKLIQ